MKTMKKLIPALAMLLVSAVLLGTSTFAWFSMNSKVYVNGMEVKTKVTGNLQIALTNAEANFTTSVTQSRKALLEPVSTVDGLAFFYHGNSNVDGVGKATDTSYVAYSESTELANTNADKANADYDFNTRYTIKGTDPVGVSGTDAEKWAATVTAANMSGIVAPAYGYVDYVFYLKGTSDNAASDLKVTKVNLMYNDAAIAGSEKAWRVAIFKEAVAAEGAGSAIGSMTLVSIMTLSGAANSYPGNAVSGTGTRSSVTYNASPVIQSDIAAGTTVYYKIAVRLWLEGEDTTCNTNTYAALTSSWKLELEFTLDDTTAAAANITSATTIIPA